MIEVHARSSYRSQLVRIGSRTFVRPALAFFPSIGPAAPFVDLVELGMRADPRLPSTQVEKVCGGDWSGELVSAKDSVPGQAAVVYFHGGAFVMCGLATHRRIAERLAQRTGLPVLSVAYRQRARATSPPASVTASRP